MLLTMRSQLALFYFFFLSINLVNALPLRVRQNGATTIRTVRTSQTPAGSVTETCYIRLTPTADENGQPVVEEVKKCSLSAGGDGGGDGTSIVSPPTSLTTSNIAESTIPPTFTSPSATGTLPATSSAISSPAATTTSSPTNSFPIATGTLTATSAATSPSTAIPTSTGDSQSLSATSPIASTASSVTSSNTLSPSSSAPTQSGIRDNGVSTVTSVPTPTSTSSVTATPTSVTPTSGDGGRTTAGDTSTSASAAAAEQPSQSSDQFQLPGKKLSVLPIGLGVFAGISVIALIVVGLVTYERTKYRKAFRQRKLAEAGASMGYGGMAQRP